MFDRGVFLNTVPMTLVGPGDEVLVTAQGNPVPGRKAYLTPEGRVSMQRKGKDKKKRSCVGRFLTSPDHDGLCRVRLENLVTTASFSVSATSSTENDHV